MNSTGLTVLRDLPSSAADAIATAELDARTSLFAPAQPLMWEEDEDDEDDEDFMDDDDDLDIGDEDDEDFFDDDDLEEDDEDFEDDDE